MSTAQSASTSTTQLPDGTWTVDPGRSITSFAAKGMWGLAPVKGTFGRVRGTLSMRDGMAAGELVLDAASLDTKNKKRDDHLHSADFFDVEQHPEVTFRLDAVRPGPTGLVADGALKVRHTTHPLTLEVEVTAIDGGHLRLTTETRVERHEVGLTWNKIGMMRGDIGLAVDLMLVRT